MSQGNLNEKVSSSYCLTGAGAKSDQHQQASGSISHALKSLWKASTGEAPPLLEKHDILIGVMGMTGVGKTSFIKQITDLNMEVGHGLDSCMFLRRIYGRIFGRNS